MPPASATSRSSDFSIWNNLYCSCRRLRNMQLDMNWGQNVHHVGGGRRVVRHRQIDTAIWGVKCKWMQSDEPDRKGRGRVCLCIRESGWGLHSIWGRWIAIASCGDDLETVLPVNKFLKSTCVLIYAKTWLHTVTLSSAPKVKTPGQKTHFVEPRCNRKTYSRKSSKEMY